MSFTRRWGFILLGLSFVLAAGCGRKEVTSLQRKQAASLISEAEFALNLRDYARAEPLLAQAVELCPDTAEFWLNLGSVRRRLGNLKGAKTAYEGMLDVVRDNYRRDGKDPSPLLQQVYVLALLGRMDDARAVLDKAQKNHPDDRNVRAFVEDHRLEHLADDPGFKEIAL